MDTSRYLSDDWKWKGPIDYILEIPMDSACITYVTLYIFCNVGLCFPT